MAAGQDTGQCLEGTHRAFKWPSLPEYITVTIAAGVNGCRRQLVSDTKSIGCIWKSSVTRFLSVGADPEFVQAAGAGGRTAPPYCKLMSYKQGLCVRH